jgi:hypothetical protein
MPRSEKSVFHQVRDAFSKLGLASPSAAVSRQISLIRMNLPANTARRDCAYDRATHLLREHLFSLPEKERCRIYRTILDLLQTTIDLSLNIAIIEKPDTSPEQDPLVQYLNILRSTVNAAFAMVRHELELIQDENALASFIGAEASSHFVTTEEICNTSEMNIFQTISELLDAADQAVRRNREQCRRAFDKNDSKRYSKALAEFTLAYDRLGKAPTNQLPQESTSNSVSKPDGAMPSGIAGATSQEKNQP